MPDFKQRDTFLQQEGDGWFDRNSNKAGSLAHRDAILKYIKPKGRILEIGCSDGKNLNFFREKTGCEGYGIDPSAKAIEAGRRSFSGVHLARGSADALAFADQEFDLVYFGFCLYLVDRALLCRVVAESDRVLSDRGYLAITDFQSDRRSKAPYKHVNGLHSYRADYPAMWKSFHYSEVEKIPFSHSSSSFDSNPNERLSHTVLLKDVDGSYPLLEL